MALTREEKLQLTVKRVSRGEGVPPFEQHAREVYARAVDANGAAADLTRIILKDLGLTSQILRVANSPLYNRSGRAILSVAHGITLLGWDTVRDLVSAMKYVEHFALRSPGVRELMLLSLLSASHARGVALRLSHPRPEDAYIAALFRNLGEILVACYCPREYCDVVLAARQHKISYRSACARVLDFSWDDLASRVGESWDLPCEVRMCLDGTGVAANSAVRRSLTSIVDYGQELTEALYRNGSGLDALHLRTVRDANGRDKLVTVRDLRSIVDAAMESATQTMTALRIPINALRVEQQAQTARAMLEAAELDAPEKCVAGHGELEAAARKLESGDFDVTSMISAVLKGVCEASGFDRALFALMSVNREWIRGRLCEGIGAEQALAAFEFPMSRPEGPMLAAIVRQRDVIVDCERDPRYRNSGLIQLLRPRSFALCPIVIEGVTAGCIYADSASGPMMLERARAAMHRATEMTASIIANAKAAEPSAAQ